MRYHNFLLKDILIILHKIKPYLFLLYVFLFFVGFVESCSRVPSLNNIADRDTTDYVDYDLFLMDSTLMEGWYRTVEYNRQYYLADSTTTIVVGSCNTLYPVYFESNAYLDI